MLRPILIQLLLAAAGVLPGAAEEALPIRPGMSLAKITELLKPRCHMFRAGDAGTGKTVTCYLAAGSLPPMITATISKKDRTFYVGWWTPVPGPDPIGTANAMAPRLGFTAERAMCDRHQKTMPCWTAADGTVLYAAGRDDRSGIFTFYLHNDRSRKPMRADA